jgi:hypothetical protein
MNRPIFLKAKYYKVIGILLLAVITDQIFSSAFFPWESELAGVKPVIVFLDIPVPLPWTMGLVGVMGFFWVYYLLFFTRPQKKHGVNTGWSASAHFSKIFFTILSLPIWIVASGLLYAFIQEWLPRPLRNGIESFGINTDLFFPFSDGHAIHLRGSMVMLAGCWLGVAVFRKNMRVIFTRMEDHQERKKPVKPQAAKDFKGTPAPAIRKSEPASAGAI